MAIASAAFIFVVLCLLAAGFASFGNRILGWLGLEMDSDREHLLVSAAIGLIFTEVLLFFVQVTQHIKIGCYGIAILLCSMVLADGRKVIAAGKRIFHTARQSSQNERRLYAIAAFALAILFIAGQAPLTGSDALHYHFTTERLILENGFHPNLSLSTSFLTGQNHNIILFGLALAGARLALALIFLGGAVAAFSIVCLASRWADGPFIPAFVLMFILAPVIFWQISTSGAPDIWSAVFVSATAIVLCQKKNTGTWRQALLAGLLAGGIAGAKYTGCVIAAAFAVAFVVEFRSFAITAIFLMSSLLSGVWPYLRNLLWIGNPVFPFLQETLQPHSLNRYVIAGLRGATGSTESHSPDGLLPFIFFAGLRATSLGFWDFYGPILVALAPLVVLMIVERWADRQARVTAIVWGMSTVFIFFTSGLARFLLPIFPLVLSCVPAAMVDVKGKNWKAVTMLTSASLVVLWVTGAAGLLVYCRKPLRVSLGLQSKTEYLQANAPDYRVTEIVNQFVHARAGGGKTLVFFRHLYYLEAPFVYGDPLESWPVNPEQLKTQSQWIAFFRDQNIRYVVRSREYPTELIQALTALEHKGVLAPVMQTQVENFQGMRIEGQLETLPLAILEVQKAEAPNTLAIQ